MGCFYPLPNLPPYPAHVATLTYLMVPWSYPLYDEALETAQHFFVECMVAKDIWIMISKWWGIG